MTVCGGAPSFLTADDLARDDQSCCIGAAMRGPGSCTCWTPTFDLEQQPIKAPSEPHTRARRCHDCAYRPDSPERARGDAVDELPNFWCHQGIRRVVEWRHPDGRVRPGDPADYQPLMTDAAPYKADGTPADRCAGWAQLQRRQRGLA